MANCWSKRFTVPALLAAVLSLWSAAALLAAGRVSGKERVGRVLPLPAGTRERFELLATAGDAGRLGEARSAQRASPSDEQIQQAVAEAFGGPEFWWKRAQRVRMPRIPWPLRALKRISDWIGSALRAIFRPIGRWLGKVFEAIGRLLARLLRGIVPRLGWRVDVRAGWGLLAGLGLVLLLAVAWFAWPVLRRWLWGERTKLARREGAEYERLASSAELLERARAALRLGRLAEALRFALLALLAELAERGLVRYDRSRTNREYYRELLVAGRELAEQFRAVAAEYERVWFGQHATVPAQVERVLRLCEQLTAGGEQLEAAEA